MILGGILPKTNFDVGNWLKADGKLNEKKSELRSNEVLTNIGIEKVKENNNEDVVINDEDDNDDDNNVVDDDDNDHGDISEESEEEHVEQNYDDQDEVNEELLEYQNAIAG